MGAWVAVSVARERVNESLLNETPASAQTSNNMSMAEVIASVRLTDSVSVRDRQNG